MDRSRTTSAAGVFRKPPVAELALFLILAIASAPTAAQVVQEKSNSEGLVLIQETPGLAFFGQPAWFRFELRNDGTAAHGDVRLILWHAYDNAQPQFVPPYCRFSFNGGNRILICEVGDLQPGDSIGASLSLIPELRYEDLPTIEIGSSIEGANLHSRFRVIHDVLKDSDRDGVTDFIERLAGTDPNDRESTSDSVWEVDAIAGYSTAAKEYYADRGGIELRIREVFDFGNEVLQNSKASIRLNLLESIELNHGEMEFANATFDHLKDDPILKLRQAESGADLSAVFGNAAGIRGDDANVICGLGNAIGRQHRGDLSYSRFREFAAVYVTTGCEAIHVLIHEIGHTLGLTHSRHDSFEAAFEFSYGHGVQDSFATIMAQESLYGLDEKVPYFSNPDVDCNGHPCGVPANRPDAADAVKTIDIIGPQMSGYFLRPWPEGMSASPAYSGDGDATTASMSVGILTGSGRYENEVAPGSTIDIVAEIRPDEADLYERATLHVLVEDPGGNLLQIDRLGRISVWDGEAGNLAPFKYVSELHVVERFAVIEDLPLGEEFAGLRFELSLAYRVGDKVVRMTKPAALSITD